jgi:hypothetical protein
MTVAEAARAFGLAEDKAIYRSIGRLEADAIAAHLLRTSLAYGTEIMSLTRASDLWKKFMAPFEGQKVEFATNTLLDMRSWTPATRATFDMGILAMGATKVGCLWVEEDD